MVRRVNTCAIALVLVACGGGDPTGGRDASVPDAGSSFGPDIPWLADGVPPIAPPVLTPCPAGWRKITDDDATVCEAYPATGAPTCGVGEAFFPGDPGCAPVGGPCPGGDFADGLADDGSVIFVRAGATLGDGSRAAPFGLLSDVSVGTLGDGETLALARGTYEGTLPLRAGARVVGVCAAATFVDAPAAPVEAIVTVTSVGVPAVVRDLTLRPAGQAGVVVRGAGRQLELDGVIVEHATGYALYATGGAHVVAREVVATDGEAQRDGLLGIGAVVDGGAELTISRAAFLRMRDAALVASGTGASLVLEDAVVRELLGRAADGLFGRGLVVESGASALLERVVVERTGDVGVFVSDVGSTVTVRSSVVRDGLGDGAGRHGRGAGAQAGAHLAIERSTFERNRGVAILASDPGTTADLSDLVIRDTVSEPEGVNGGGINAELGAHVSVARLVVVRARDIALGSLDTGASMTLADVIVRDVLPRELDGLFGRGMAVERGATLDVSRAVVERVTELGIYALDNSVLTVTDALVSSTRSVEVDGTFGRGIDVEEGSTGNLRRVVVRGSHDVGIVGLDSNVTVADAVVEDTLPRGCVSTTCPTLGFGHGLVASGGMVVVRGFAIRRSALCGVFIEVGTLDLERGEVSSSPIGACVQTPGYDISRLTREVRYSDNEVNLDTTTLPVPPPAAPRNE